MGITYHEVVPWNHALVVVNGRAQENEPGILFDVAL